ncbi:hypothetical protein K501DRAFT_267499 [Backusella circina FSU 941]|nr:hypothetical protein K501DRAFT_267499 [Backusella circina FSU 941]
MTYQFITQIPIKSSTHFTIKQLLLTCIFTLQFIVLYCFFFGHIVSNLIQRWKKISVNSKELLLLKNQEENPVTHISTIQSTESAPIITVSAQEKQEIPSHLPPPLALPITRPSIPSPASAPPMVTRKPPTIIHNTFKPTQNSQIYAMAEKIQLPEVVTGPEKDSCPSLSTSPSFLAMMAPLNHPVPEIELFLSQSVERLPPLSPPRSGSLSPSSSVASSETLPLKSRFHAAMQKAVRPGESRLGRFASLRREKHELDSGAVRTSLSSKLQNKLKKSGKGLTKMFQ